MNPIQLQNDISIESLFPNISKTQIEKVKKLAENGFTEQELQELMKDGIDTSLLLQNASGVSKISVDSKAQEIKQKYCSNLPKYSGDVYSASNPELQAFSQALKDGLISDLSSAGYSKNEIIEIISKAFPTIGIKNTDDGSYTLPKGHGAEAKQIYDQFLSNIAVVTGLNTPQIQAAKQKLADINRQIQENNRELKTLEYDIVSLQISIEDKINDAIDESKEIAEEQKEESKKIVKKRLDEYVNSNGKISYETFQSNVSADLDVLAGETNSKLSAAVSEIFKAMSEMNTLNGYLTRMNTLIKSNADLAKQADETKEEIKKLQDEMLNQDNAGDDNCKRCDPIGFTDASGVRYDFFVDKDENGDITNENEFVGASAGFSEMVNNDLNGDKKVDAAELDKNNVKVIVTNPDGTRQIKKASEVFKEGDTIDLNSYTVTNKDIGNGNTQLGSFNVNMNGQTLATGYQTMDTLDWLDENFEFTDEAEGKGRHSGTSGGAFDSIQALDFSGRYKDLKSDSLRLKNKVLSGKSTVNNNSVKAGESITNAESEARIKGKTVKDGFERDKSAKDKEQQLKEQILEFEEFEENP